MKIKLNGTSVSEESEIKDGVAWLFTPFCLKQGSGDPAVMGFPLRL